MTQPIDDYDMRCVGHACLHSNRCQRYCPDPDSLMPWTPVVPNICQMLEKNHFVAHRLKAAGTSPVPRRNRKRLR